MALHVTGRNCVADGSRNGCLKRKDILSNRGHKRLLMSLLTALPFNTVFWVISMNTYLVGVRLVLRIMFLTLLSSFATAQNSGIEPQGGKKAKDKHLSRIQAFHASVEEKEKSQWSYRGRFHGSLAEASRTLGRSNTGKLSADNVSHAWVKHYGPELESVSDRAFDMAVDKSDNIYVAGSSDHDFLTIKYNASGSQQWMKHYSAAEYSDNCATSLTVDAAGSIYVGGYSDGFNDGYDYDYVIMKYDTDGNKQWIVHYDAHASFYPYYDKLFMSVDRTGNVYCAATNNGKILKYDASGHLQWVTPISQRISTLGLTIDPAGCAYITGECVDSTSTFLVIAKVDSCGNELWLRQHRRDFKMDLPSAIALDDSGNVIVTGFAFEYADDITQGAYITIKYDPAGTEQWIAFYDGPKDSYEFAEDLVVDSCGNVYVTGSSGECCATVKYNSSGIEQWVARYCGTDSEVEGSKISVDAQGSVVVTGYSFPSTSPFSLDYMTIKYDGSGEEQWVRFYSRLDSSFDQVTALIVDESGSVCITGLSYDPVDYYDCVTIKYDGSGDQQWAARYDAPKRAYAGANAVAVDQAGDIYTTGGCYGQGIVTIKYSPTGDELWTASYNGWAYALAVDESGNAYVTGKGTYAGSNSPDYITIKYNTDGIEQWVAHYDGTAHGHDEPAALALDIWGNVYVTGFSYGGTDTLNEDYATVKYSPSGIQQWVARYDGPSRTSDHALAIAADAHGNSYVTGKSWNSSTSSDIVTIKYDPFGMEKWVARFDGQENSLDQGTAVGVDAGGNVYVTGSSTGTGTGLDYTTIKYDSSGTQLWVARYNGPANQDDAACALKVDGSGNIYVTGYSNCSDTSSDFATVKYNPAGAEQWVARYNGPEDGIDEAVALTIGPLGNIYVTGKSQGSGSLFDIATINYDTAGICTWVTRFNEDDMPDNYATAIAADAAENIYVAGYSGSEERRFGYAADIGIANKTSKYTLVKYSHDPVSVEGNYVDVPRSFRLEQNYPNPFNPSTQINYSIPWRSHITLRVYSVLGQEVMTLFEGDSQPGNYAARFDARGLASGVYYYRIQAGFFVKTMKMLLVH
jgi:uncharacterized delta-60 repeat protein